MILWTTTGLDKDGFDRTISKTAQKANLFTKTTDWQRPAIIHKYNCADQVVQRSKGLYKECNEVSPLSLCDANFVILDWSSVIRSSFDMNYRSLTNYVVCYYD